jgi:hypothetical protein
LARLSGIQKKRRKHESIFLPQYSAATTVVSRTFYIRKTCWHRICVSEVPLVLSARCAGKDFPLRSAGKSTALHGAFAGAQDWRRSGFAAEHNTNRNVVTGNGGSMRFFGKTFSREDAKPDPTGNALGASLEKEIERGVVAAQANARALQTARANEAKRRRDEDKAVAAMLAQDYERI